MYIRTSVGSNHYLLKSARHIFFRNTHVYSKTLTQEHIHVYQEAMVVSNDDPSLTTKDMINKGFSYLCSDKQAYYFNALVCFERAQKKMKDENLTKEARQECDRIINCGIEEAKSKNTSLNCFHFIK